VAARQAELDREEATRDLHDTRQHVSRLLEEADEERARRSKLATEIVEEAHVRAEELAREARLDRHDAARAVRGGGANSSTTSHRQLTAAAESGFAP